MATIIFDLDGTISDPARGITESINYALNAMGYQSCEIKDLLKFIGPSLDNTFKQLLNTLDCKIIKQAIKHYRKNYIEKGFAQNKLYPEIVWMLQKLKLLNHQLYIATSKRQDIALKVIQHFNITSLFTKILGCGLNLTKTDLLKAILAEGYTPYNCIMVGDRDLDFNSAKAVNIKSIAVTWGYGCSAEFEIASHITNTPAELLNTIEFLTPQ